MINWILQKFEKCYHHLTGTHSKLSFPILILIPLGLILISGWVLNQKVRNIAIENFNQQQLMLARHAAFQIKNSLEF